MESLAFSLGIPRNSGIYGRAQEIYHKVNLRLGNSAKFTSTCLMVCALKLATDSFNIDLDPASAAKKAGVVLRVLNSCLELIVSTLGGDIGLVSIESIVKSIGYPAISPLAEELLRELRSALPDNQRTQFSQTTPTIMAASIHLIMQAIGLRLSVGALCGAAYANPQNVQRCALEIKGYIGGHLTKLGENEKLIKKIKDEGKTVVRRKRLDFSREATSGGTITSADSQVKRPSLAPALSPMQRLQRDMSLVEQHYFSELGYAVMLPSSPMGIPPRSQPLNFNVSACNF